MQNASKQTYKEEIIQIEEESQTSSSGITPTTSKSETFLKKKNQGHQQFNHEKKDSYT